MDERDGPPDTRTEAGSPPRRRRRVPAGTFAVGLVGVLWLTGCMERLFYHPDSGPTPPPADPPGVEAVEFASSDGTRLFGWFLPARGGAEGAATILHVHGNAGNIASHVWFTEYLPDAGFNVFLFDYRGYGQSEGAARRRNDLIADTDAALDTVLARDDVDPERVGLYAQSLGGGIGLNVMVERPELRAAVVESSFTSWRDIAADAIALPEPIARLIATVLIRDHRRPDEAIAAIDRPILVIHGTDDSVIPVEHGQRLAAAGPTAELVELRGGEHNTLRETHPKVERLAIRFFGKHLARSRR